MEILGILTGEVLHKSTNAVRHLAGDDEMEVVGQQCVAMNHDLAEVGVVVEQREKFSPVVVGEEDRLPVISTLGDMQWGEVSTMRR